MGTPHSNRNNNNNNNSTSLTYPIKLPARGSISLPLHHHHHHHYHRHHHLDHHHLTSRSIDPHNQHPPHNRFHIPTTHRPRPSLRIQIPTPRPRVSTGAPLFHRKHKAPSSQCDSRKLTFARTTRYVTSAVHLHVVNKEQRKEEKRTAPLLSLYCQPVGVLVSPSFVTSVRRYRSLRSQYLLLLLPPSYSSVERVAFARRSYHSLLSRCPMTLQ